MLLNKLLIDSIGPLQMPPWGIMLYKENCRSEYTNGQNVDLYCTFPRTNYTQLHSIKMFKNTTIIYTMNILNNGEQIDQALTIV